MLRRLKDTLRPWHPRNIRRTLLERKERQSGHVHVFSSNPAALAITRQQFSGTLHDVMRDRPFTLCYLFYWALDPQNVINISARIREDQKNKPHRVVMLCNEEFTVDLFRAQGVEAIFCNHNCLVNEHNFTIDPAQEKKYDAIYNAAMAPYKRHLLATKIDSLALITYRYGGTHEKDYEAQTQSALAHATWLVNAHKDSEKASQADVARFANQSRVGLCLSAREGAMYASIEYLLCGIPVVTTKSRGGRDAFFDPDYVETVEDDPEAVKQGVANLIARAPSAEIIRARTLAKMEEHRQRLRDALRNEVPHLEIPWPPGTHGPLSYRNLRELGKTLRDAAGKKSN